MTNALPDLPEVDAVLLHRRPVDLGDRHLEHHLLVRRVGDLDGTHRGLRRARLPTPRGSSRPCCGSAVKGRFDTVASRMLEPPAPWPLLRLRQRLPVHHDRPRAEHDDAGDVGVADRHALHGPAELEDAALPALDPDRLARRRRGVGGRRRAPGSRRRAERSASRCPPRPTARPGAPLGQALLRPPLPGSGAPRRDAAREQRRGQRDAPRAAANGSRPSHSLPHPRAAAGDRRSARRHQNRSCRVTFSPSSTSTECRGRAAPASRQASGARAAPVGLRPRTSNSVPRRHARACPPAPCRRSCAARDARVRSASASVSFSACSGETSSVTVGTSTGLSSRCSMLLPIASTLMFWSTSLLRCSWPAPPRRLSPPPARRPGCSA